MICKFCGKEIDETSQECPYCGGKLVSSNDIHQEIDVEIPSKQKKKHQDPLKDKFNLFPVSTHILLFLVGWIGLSLIATLVAIIISSIYKSQGVDVSEGFPLLGNVLNNFFAYLLTIGVLPLAIGITVGFKSINEIFKQFKNKSALIDGLAYGFLLLVVTAALGLIINTIRGSSEVNDNESAIRLMAVNYPILLSFMTIIFAPICEELTYRLGLYNVLRRHNRILAYVITALVFALIHFTLPEQGENFNAKLINELWNIPSYIVSGVILCRAYEKHQSIATSMIAHAINNAVAVISVIIMSR